MTLKIKLIAFTMLAITFIAILFSQKKIKTEMYTPSETPGGFVVMELFTSQGCSSCPPADNLLGKYAAKNNGMIIPLAFHVDYWNRLGWTDSFSSAKYTERQQNYANVIGGSSVYTPQLIINGTRELVGSEEGNVAALVANALKEQPKLSITIDKAESTANTVSVNYTIDQMLDNTILNVALVQKQAFTNILKGENRGLRLTNYNVVRDFITRFIKIKSSSVDLQMPKGYNTSDFAVVLYVQENTSGKIIGATKKDL